MLIRYAQIFTNQCYTFVVFVSYKRIKRKNNFCFAYHYKSSRFTRMYYMISNKRAAAMSHRIILIVREKGVNECATIGSRVRQYFGTLRIFISVSPSRKGCEYSTIIYIILYANIIHIYTRTHTHFIYMHTRDGVGAQDCHESVMICHPF